MGNTTPGSRNQLGTRNEHDEPKASALECEPKAEPTNLLSGSWALRDAGSRFGEFSLRNRVLEATLLTADTRTLTFGSLFLSAR